MTDALQAALTAIDSADAELLAKAKAAALMSGYDLRWRTAGYVTVAAEQPYHLPVINPDTMAASKSFTQVGVIDALAELDGRTFAVEHKTTSEDIADPNSSYWRRLTIDSQVSKYALANWQSGNKVDGTLYDVIRKPTIRPKKLAAADRKGITSLGTYCHGTVSDQTQSDVVAGLETENAELFGLRLAADVIERPEFYYARRMIQRLDGEILEWAADLWDLSQDLLATKRRGRWPKTSAACMSFGSPCEFLGLCSGHDSVDSDRWGKRQTAAERLGIDADQAKVTLSHSALSCFQQCKRKYYYRYVQGIERVDDEQSEALMFGSLMHLALEAWWLSFLPESEVTDGNSSNAANGVASDSCETQPCGLDQDRQEPAF